MAFADLSRAASLGFQSGEGMVSNPLGDAIRGMLQTWQQQKQENREFEKSIVLDQMNFERQKSLKEMELDAELGVEKQAFVQMLEQRLEEAKKKGMTREEVYAEIGKDMPSLKMGHGWKFGADFEDQVYGIVDAAFPQGGPLASPTNPLNLTGAQALGYTSAKAGKGVFKALNPASVASKYANVQLGGLSAFTGKKYPEVSPEMTWNLDPRYSGWSAFSKLFQKRK